jgi:signal transduction histidine kinase
MWQRVEPEDRPRLKASTRRSATALTLWCEEYRVRLPRRGLRWLRGEAMPERQADGSVVWHGYITDITERKLAQQQLQELHHRLALATRAGGIGVWDWDLTDDNIVWDERMYELYQIAPEPPLRGSDIPSRAIHPDDFAAAERQFKLALADARFYDVEYRIVWPDGQERTLQSAGVVSRAADGRPTRITGITWDLTERKRIERMKSEFVATVSHELRTPLTSIRGTLGLIAGGVVGALPEKIAELIRIAHKNSERLSLLIDDILDIERIESGRIAFTLQRQPLMPLIEQAIEANNGYAQTYTVELVLAQALPGAVVAVDAHRLLQVMANLLSNAVKFSPPHAQIAIAVAARAGNARVEVRDRGPGLPETFRARVFQKFSQADASDSRAKGGTGLGLSIAKAIVEHMGGTIGFETRAGLGTTFFFELPLSDAAAIAHEPRANG